MKQSFNLTVPQQGTTYFEISEDQEAVAGESLTFMVSRTDATENPYQGEASVRVSTVDGSAVAGTHYETVDETLKWAAGDTADKPVTVVTNPGAAGSEARAFSLELSDPDPAASTELGGGAKSDVTIIYPTPEITRFSISAPQIVDAGTAVRFDVTRADAEVKPWTGEASVRVVSHDATAIAGEHFVKVDETLTWAAGESGVKSVTVKTEPGKAGDPNRAFVLRLTDAQPHAFAKPARLAFSGAVLTYPVPGTTLFGLSGDQSGAAGDTFTFEVTRADAAVDPWTGEASVHVSTKGGTAEADTHFVPFGETLVWDAGDSDPKTVELKTLVASAGDPVRELQVVLSQSEPSAYTAVVEPSTSTVSLTSPEPGATVFAFGEGQTAAVAGESMTFLVTRTNAEVNPWTGESSVRVSTEDGSAVAGTHYEPVDETLVWDAGDSEPKTVELKTLKTLSAPAGAAAAKQATVTAENAASLTEERTFTLVLSEPSAPGILSEQVRSVGLITYETNEPDEPNEPGEEGGGDGGTKPTPGPGGGSGNALADTGMGTGVWGLSIGGASLLMLAGICFVAMRGRKKTL